MKKVFTLIAAALMAVGASAQTIDFATVYTDAQAAGSVNDITLGEGSFTAQFTGGSKANIAVKSLTFKVDESSAAENFTMQWCPGGSITKLSGERSVTIKVDKAGTLTIYPRSGGNDDRAFTVQQNGETILNGTAYNGVQIEEKYYKAWTVEVAAGTVNILADNAINISALKFEAAEGGEEPTPTEPTESEVYASWNQSKITGDVTYTAVGTAVIEDYTSKIHSNKDQVTCMTFPNSAIASGEFVNYVKIEGDFKAGDIITVQPFTSMSTADFTGSANGDGVPTKYANIVLYTTEGELIADITGSTAAAKTVTDGHEEAGDPKTFSYALTADYTTLCVGRQGNSRINIIKIEFARPVETGINNVVVKNNTNGAIYNLAGQKVSESYKGVVIKNGRKYVQK